MNQWRSWLGQHRGSALFVVVAFVVIASVGITDRDVRTFSGIRDQYIKTLWDRRGFDDQTITISEKQDKQGNIVEITKTTTEKPKTLWDVASLVGVPLVLFGLGAWFQSRDKKREADKQKDAILQNYFDNMKGLLLDQQLKTSEAGAEVRDIARILTLNVLRQLDSPRNKLITQFLQESGLIRINWHQGQAADTKTESPLLSLGDADLSNAKLSGANLRETFLCDANLNGADLRDANLTGAFIIKADLRGANLRGANLTELFLTDANLSNAYLNKANLTGTDLTRANLSGANLSNADLRGAEINLANLSKANLSNAKLDDAQLRGTDLKGADLSDAYLIRAYLNNANLSDADLCNADLTGSHLNGADFSGASLSGTNFINADLSCAIFLKTDLSTAKYLTDEWLEGENAPYLYKAELPPTIDAIDVDKLARDYEELPQILMNRYPERFKTIEEAKRYMEE